MHIGLWIIIYVVLFMLVFVCGCIAGSVKSDPEKEAKDSSLARKRKKKELGFLFAAIFFFGSLFVFMGYCIYETDAYRTLNWIPVQAKISGTYYDRLDERRTFLVNYVINGTVYEKIRLGYYSSFENIGDAIPILVDPSSPTTIQNKPSTPIAPMIFGGIGGLISLIALYNIISVLLGTSRWLVTSNKAPKTLGTGSDATTVIAGKGFEAEWKPEKEPAKIWKYLFIFVIAAIVVAPFVYTIYDYWQTDRNSAYTVIALLLFVVLNMLRLYLKNKKKKEDEKDSQP